MAVEKQHVSKKAGMKRVRHKAYSYKAKSGKVVAVAAHFERVHESKSKKAPKQKAASKPKARRQKHPDWKTGHGPELTWTEAKRIYGLGKKKTPKPVVVNDASAHEGEADA